MTNLSQSRVVELFSYTPETGLFCWRRRLNNQINTDRVPAGHVDNRGYFRIKVDGKKYLRHRLIWLWMTGAFPVRHIDHINGDRTDNRWDNLREATPVQNGGNQRIAKNNTSGFKGVHWSKDRKCWIASVRFNKMRYHLGGFSRKVDAARAYDQTAIRLFGEYARPNLSAASLP